MMMKKFFALLLASLTFSALSAQKISSSHSQSRASVAPKDKADFSVVVKGYHNQPVVLGYYYNNKMLGADTVFTDGSGTARFQRDSVFNEGIYVIHFPKNGIVFDMLMPAVQKFTLSCDTAKRAADRVSVRGSKPLQNFFDYQRFLGQQQQEYSALSQEFRAAKSDDERAAIRLRFAQKDSLNKAHADEVIAQNRDNFIANFLTAIKEVEIPRFEMPASFSQLQADSAQRVRGYYYYRAHFYDNFHLNDERLLRTPFFVSKVDKYFEETIPQIPDTVAAEAIRLIEACRPNKEMFRYFLSHLYNMTNNSKIMGMDKALVILAEKYYLAGQADWVDDKFISELRDQVDGIKYTLVGNKAPDIKMVSVSGEWFRLSEVKAPYTVLVFWEPSCGHCKKEIPHLKSQIWDKYRDKGVKIFAVYCQVDEEPWKKFIEEHELDEWMNVYDPYGRSGFRRFYNIKSTPTFFVLDKDKTIVTKRLGVDQIDDFLAHMFAEGNN